MSHHQEWTIKYLKQDLPASIAVFLVAIPLCLGIAHASGTPLISGLITGVIGGMVVGALSKSPLSVSGPAAGLTAIIAAAAMQLQSFEALLVAILLAGLIQVGLGVLRAGSIAAYIPSAVIHGMLSAIGLILILKQLPHLMGFDAESEGTENFIVHQNEMAAEATQQAVQQAAPAAEAAQQAAQHAAPAGEAAHHGIGNTFSLIGDAFMNMQEHIFAIGLVAIALMVLWDKTLGKRFKMVPSSLLAVVFGTLMALAYKWLMPALTPSTNHLVQVPPIKSLGDFLQQTHFPDFSVLSNPQVYVVALTIALVASIETLLSIEAIDKLDPHRRRTPTNRELLAQGVGNSVCGLIGGLPMTSVIVRSSVNQVAGAETKLSAIFHGFWILIAVLLAAPVINQIPLAALAAVLIVTGYKLANPKQFVGMYKNGWDQLIPYVVTVLAIVLSDLLIGVLIGMLVSGAFILYSHYRSEVVEVMHEGNVWHLTFAENLTFLNKARVLDILSQIPDGSKVYLYTSRCKYIDHDIAEAIQEFKLGAAESEIEVIAEGLSQAEQVSGPEHQRRLEQLAEAHQ